MKKMKVNNPYLELPEGAKPYIDNLRDLWKFSEEEMRGKTFQTKDDFRLIILMQITTATSRILHAVLAQIDGNSFYGLDYLLRPIVEGLINYKYIKEDETQMRARAFISDDINIRLRGLNKLIPFLEQSDPSQTMHWKDVAEYQKLKIRLISEKDEFESKYGKNNLNFRSLHDRATKSGTLGVYATIYWLLCQDTHLSSRGLDRLMKVDSGQLSVTYDLELDRFILALKTLYLIFAALLAECSEQFGIPNKTGLNKLTSGTL